MFERGHLVDGRTDESLGRYERKWVETYLLSLKNVTCIIVSHDTGLLDRVCDNIIAIDNLKLKQFKGNLTEYVAKNPKAKQFFELKSATGWKMQFPQPGFIEGVKSKGKPLMKMANCTYTYPVNQVPTVKNVTVQVSLASRVACEARTASVNLP